MDQPPPKTLDHKIAAISPQVDEELRIGLKTRLRALRRGEPGEHIVTLLIMVRWSLRLLDMIFASVGRKRPNDNAYDCIITAANGDGQKAGLDILPATIVTYLHTIRRFSNKADHAKDVVEISDSGKSALDNVESVKLDAPDLPIAASEPIFQLTSQDAEIALNSFLCALEWYYCDYERGPRLPTVWTEQYPIFTDNFSELPFSSFLEQETEKSNLFVGRQGELKTLFEHGDALLHNRGITGFVVGEGGIGKSSLAVEFAKRFVSEHTQTIFAMGRCDMVSGHGSYALFKSVMEQILVSDKTVTVDGRRLRPIDIVCEVIVSLGSRDIGSFASFTGIATEVLCRKLRERTQSLPGMGVNVSLDQAAVFDWYSKIIRSVSNYFPLIILLDDIHWADESSLLMLLHLGRVIANCPMLIIGIYRPEEIKHNNLLLDVQNQLNRIGAFTVNLSTSQRKEDDHNREIYQFCREYMLAKYDKVLAEDLLELLVRLSKGNALYLSETLINLEEKGYIAYRNNRWILEKEIEHLEQLPTRIEAIISERLNRLDDDLQDVVKCASVEGENFTAQVVASVEKEEERCLLRKIVNKLIGHHRVVQEDGTKRLPNGSRFHFFRFNHIFTQRYIYENLLTSVEREMFHEDIANCLESLWAEYLSDISPQLATHYSLAGVHEKTAIYACMAAHNFLRQYGWSEVTRFARLGVEAYENAPDQATNLNRSLFVELHLLYAKGELQGGIRRENIDHVQAGITALQKCLSSLDKLDASLVADVYLTLGKSFAVKRDIDREKVDEYFHRALEIYEKLGDREGIIAVLSPHEFDSNLANQLVRSEQLNDRLRCLKLAEELDDPIILANSLNNLARYYVNFNTDEAEPLTRAEEYAIRSLKIAQNTQNPIVELNSLLMLSWVYHCHGHYGEKLETLRNKVLTLARQHGQTLIEAEALTDLGHYYSFLLDHQDRAGELMKEAYEFRSRMGRHTVIDCEQYGDFLYRQGDFERSVSLFEESLENAQDIFRTNRIRSQIALISLLTNKPDEGSKQVRKIEESVEANPSLDSSPNSKLMLVYALFGDRQKAIAEVKKIEKVIECWGRRGVFHIFTDCLTEMAETYRLLGYLDEANHWIRVAGQYWEKLTQVTDIQEIVMFWEHEFVRGKVIASRGEHDHALSIFQKVQSAFKKASHYMQAELLLARGRSLYELGLEDQGKITLQEAIISAHNFNLADVVCKADILLRKVQK